MNGNRKLSWKEVSNAKGEKVESYSRIKGQMGGWYNKSQRICIIVCII